MVCPDGVCDGKERVTTKMPDVAGIKATSPREREKVCSSSCAYCFRHQGGDIEEGGKGEWRELGGTQGSQRSGEREHG
jgi:hypothetical protein